jgi:hypothetical protein
VKIPSPRRERAQEPALPLAGRVREFLPDGKEDPSALFM